MQNILFEILENDYNKFLLKIYKSYGLNKHITFEKLKEKYKLQRIVFYKTKIQKKAKYNIQLPDNDNRCIARVWGGKESVIKKDGIWSYGYRCKRKKCSNIDFCKLHMEKQPHGIYNLEPPHNHYNKYKN